MIFNIGGFENIKGKMPEFTYTGNYQLIDDGITNGVQNWRLKLLTSGTLTFSKVVKDIDLFLVGGGSGVPAGATQAGGGGGYTSTQKSVAVKSGTAYTVTVGAGGAGGGGAGGSSSFGSLASVAGGGSDGSYQNGGSGGGGGGNNGPGGNGGSDGSHGSEGYNGVARGTGQGTTTREFGESGATLYAGGGGGATNYAEDYETPGQGGAGGGGKGYSPNGGSTSGVTNTGGGGGGGYGAGGSGIVIIRNAR